MTIRWCAYCQQFLGESPPYEDFSLTHGMCPACEALGFDLTDEQLSKVNTLRKMQARLREAGESADISAAIRLVDQCIVVGVRPIDVLIGLIAPLLYQIGEEWACGVRTVAQEHRFTKFCQECLEMIGQRTLAASGVAPEETCHILMWSAEGNMHTLGPQISALWFVSKGVSAQVLRPGSSRDQLFERLEAGKPRFLGVSISLPEQLGAVEAIRDAIAKSDLEFTPSILVGGYAVKQGLVAPRPGLRLVRDLGAILNVLRAPGPGGPLGPKPGPFIA